MAEKLIHDYGLPTLKVSLDTSSPQVKVCLVIERQGEGEYKYSSERQVPAEIMGLPDRLEQRRTRYHGYDFVLPGEVLVWLKECVEDVNPEHGPLWLHLSKPYGYLGMVPWERLMQEELGVPILRVPEFLANPPRENPSILDVVLCSSMPTAKGSFLIVNHIVSLINQIQSTVPRRTTIHVFLDRESYIELNPTEFDASVRFYDPETASSYTTPEATLRIEGRPGQVQNPWLLWIRDSLKETSIDVVHFVTHGYMSSDRGALAIAESPLYNQDERMARFVGAAELATFYTQIGAWATVFSSPENNYSEMGLRQLADTIGQMRPGPVVYHEIPLDWDAVEIGNVYRFLFGRDSHTPPATPSIFMYCHPSRVKTYQAGTSDTLHGDKQEHTLLFENELMEDLASPASVDLEQAFFENNIEEESLPNWISATERFIEQQNYDLYKLSQYDDEPRRRDVQTVRDTLKEIGDIMSRYSDKLGRTL